jgi:hypothetical protein
MPSARPSALTFALLAGFLGGGKTTLALALDEPLAYIARDE